MDVLSSTNALKRSVTRGNRAQPAATADCYRRNHNNRLPRWSACVMTHLGYVSPGAVPLGILTPASHAWCRTSSLSSGELLLGSSPSAVRQRASYGICDLPLWLIGT